MFIAQQKRKENLAEFILYIFQVEDLIRAFDLNMERIKNHVVSKYNASPQQLAEVTDWYNNLALMMEKEGIRFSGHLQFLVNHINQMNELHLKLVSDEEIAPGYLTYYKTCIGLINEFRLKGDPNANDIATCIDAIYGYLLLKIQKKEITPATADAIKRFAALLGQLSAFYKDYESGDLEL